MMKILIAMCILASIAFADENRWGVEEKSDVSQLTNENFEEFIKKHKFVFVKFYAPWCGHCKEMAPSYAKLAAKMNLKTDGIPIAELDATVHGEIAEKYGVDGYPALKFFVDGEPIDYSGEREGSAIENFINKKINPLAKEIKTEEELKDLSNEKFAILLVTKGADESQLEIFNKFSSTYDYQFLFATFPQALTQLSLTDKYNVVVFRNFDDGMKVLSSPNVISAEDMKEFLNKVKNPTLLEFDQEGAEKIFGGEENAVFIFTDEASNEKVEIFKQVAHEKKGEIIFSKSSITEGMGQRLAEFLGIKESENNLITIIKFEAGSVHKFMLKDYDKEKLIEFLNDFKEGKLTPFFKSDPIPENNSDPVKVIVGKNFEEMIIKNDKWVLLEIYAPWCGHCKKLTPIYEELAKKLINHDDILICKMDGTTNEHESVAIKGFPTLKFFRKGDKQNPIDFEGDRNLESFLSFLQKETGKDLGASEVKSETNVEEEL